MLEQALWTSLHREIEEVRAELAHIEQVLRQMEAQFAAAEKLQESLQSVSAPQGVPCEATPQMVASIPAVPPVSSSSETSTESTSLRKDARCVEALRKAIGLNDRFRFRHDLFGNDNQLYETVIDRLDSMHSMEEAKAYLAQFSWNEEDATVVYFYELLSRRYA